MTKNKSKEFKAFLESLEQFQQKICDNLVKPRKYCKPSYKKIQLYYPKKRGSGLLLVPRKGKIPCDECKDAKYNQLCPHTFECVCFAYWGLTAIPATKKENSHGN